ncbi:MAG: lysophospholipid acyltransferase family protein [Pseudomonadota bacterium]
MRIILGSIAFNLFFYLWTALVSISGAPMLVLPRRVASGVQRFWAHGVLWALKWLVGITYRVEGHAYAPSGPVLVAGNHQSSWETLAFYVLLDDPAYVLKRELIWLPFFGWIGWRTGQIPIDRKGGAKALRQMLKAADKAVRQGRPVVIFPEGTRAPVGAPRPYQPGVAGLYRHLGLPVVPMAVNSGLYWGRRSFVKRPGVIRVRYLPPIPPGLDKRTFMTTLASRIETAAAQLASGNGE